MWVGQSPRTLRSPPTTLSLKGATMLLTAFREIWETITKPGFWLLVFFNNALDAFAAYHNFNVIQFACCITLMITSTILYFICKVRK
jgi:hypothetical protein